MASTSAWARLGRSGTSEAPELPPHERQPVGRLRHLRALHLTRARLTGRVQQGLALGRPGVHQNEGDLLGRGGQIRLDVLDRVGREILRRADNDDLPLGEERGARQLRERARLKLARGQVADVRIGVGGARAASITARTARSMQQLLLSHHQGQGSERIIRGLLTRPSHRLPASHVPLTPHPGAPLPTRRWNRWADQADRADRADRTEPDRPAGLAARLLPRSPGPAAPCVHRTRLGPPG